uniref:Bm5827 n=1 Tax=Brugia malayi TaxID=6279 RepID=A0A1I9G7B6_BRUMA|nr:Bm5827 [Brugia malayi]
MQKQYQYTSKLDYRRRPSHLIINNIKKLRPFKSTNIVTEPFDQQIKQSLQIMNNTILERSHDEFQNIIKQTYPRSKLFSSYSKNEMNRILPKVISPFLQNFNDNGNEEKPISVKPKLRSTSTTTATTTTTTTTTITITPLTSQPMLLSRISPGINIDEAKQARIQARWRKLGPLVKSIQYPYVRRNWNRIILTKDSNEPSHFSNRMQKIIKRLRQQQQQQQSAQILIDPEKVEKRPRVDGILLSNVEIKSKLFPNEVDEWPTEIVKPTTTTLSTTTTNTAIVTTTVPVTNFVTEITPKPTTIDTIAFTDNAPTIIPTTTITSTIASSLSSSSLTTSIPTSITDFDSTTTTTEPNSFPFSTSSNDYHFRKITPAKKFKFAQKFRRQPRLKIRKPDDRGPLRGNQTASGRSPIILPQLEPLNLENKIGQESLNNDANGPSVDSSDLFGGASSSGFDNFDKSIEFKSESGKTEIDNAGFGTGKFPTDEYGLTGFGGGKPPPVDFSQANVGIFGSSEHKQSTDDHNTIISTDHETTKMTTERIDSTDSSVETTSLHTTQHLSITSSTNSQSVLKNSGLIPALPPSEFDGDFGTGKRGAVLGGTFRGTQTGFNNFDNEVKESIFTGDSALTPNRLGPTGDGLGPPIPSGAAIPPPVPAVGIGGAAAGILPTLSDRYIKTQNPPTTIKPSALLNFLTKADIGFNQAINHFEQGTPIESAAIDILEVALGSEKLDSQAKLLGHIDRTIGIDNLQRLQRWVNTGGALDALKEQLANFVKNYTIPENLLPTVPPQLQYLFAPGRKR